MMTKNRFPAYYITILFFLFLFYPIAASASIAPGSEKIPDSIVSLSSGYIIVVDKQYQRIYVFQKNGGFSKVFEAPCSTGKKHGSKQVEGDAKTPNGIFFATKFLQNPGPPEVYGSMAFPLDYPTISDKRAGRNGNNIWIHGTTKKLLPTQSNGCVVLHDSDLRILANFIYFNKTPVIISEFLKWVPQNQVSPAKAELERILTSWNKAFIERDTKTIDSLYMQGSEIKGKRREELNSKIKNLKNINKHFILQPRDISILQENNNAVIIFDQIFAVNNNNSFQGFYNKLILEKINNRWYVTDDATPAPAANKVLAKANSQQKVTPPPVVANQTVVPVNTSKPPETKSISKEDVRSLVNKWVSSWKSGDMKIYRNCYAANFQSKGMNLNDWVSYKANVRQNSNNINVSIDNLQISSDGDIATAVFTQHYSSSILKNKGKKKLELRKINNEWKISKELMQP